MQCIDCKASNPEDNAYCGNCGAEMGRTLDETIRKRGFRDRTATEMEITTAVVDRLFKWFGWLGSAAAVILAVFGYFVGKSTFEVRSVASAGKTEIASEVKDGKAAIATAKQQLDTVESQVTQLQSDVNKYQQVDSRIAKLQRDLLNVRGQVVDLGKRRLKVDTLETTGNGPGLISFKTIGCPPGIDKNTQFGFCAEASPLRLMQISANGDRRPVSSVSTIGFQDASTSSKPSCDSNRRGTFFVEKGTGSTADRPFICVKNAENSYDWIPLGTSK